MGRSAVPNAEWRVHVELVGADDQVLHRFEARYADSFVAGDPDRAEVARLLAGRLEQEALRARTNGVR